MFSCVSCALRNSRGTRYTAYSANGASQELCKVAALQIWLCNVYIHRYII